MTNSNSNDDEKLGHDPLEWLSEDGSESEVMPAVTGRADAETQPLPETAPEASIGLSPHSHPDAPDNDEGVFVLPESVTVQHIESLHSELRDFVEKTGANTHCIVDFSHAVQLDSSGYQLLISAIKTCADKDVTFIARNIQTRLKTQLTLFGDNQVLAAQGESGVE